MTKKLLNISALSAMAVAMLAICNIASADTVTGRLSTGLGGCVGDCNGVNGVVVAPPVANPPAGVYASGQSVTLTADGSTGIRYTTDGATNPSCTSGTAYSDPISVDSSLVILAISCYPNNASSTVVAYQYAINPPSGGGGTNNVVTSSGGGGGGGEGSSGGGSVSLFSRGDANGDSRINILDFVVLMADWGQAGSRNPADFNGDGRVDIQDFVTLMANWTN